jgi:hypothetical protein
MIGRVISQGERDRVELRLELDRGIEPIHGRITTEDGATVEFAGWLALAGALQRLSTEERPSDSAGGRQATG